MSWILIELFKNILHITLVLLFVANHRTFCNCALCITFLVCLYFVNFCFSYPKFCISIFIDFTPIVSESFKQFIILIFVRQVSAIVASTRFFNAKMYVGLLRQIMMHKVSFAFCHCTQQRSSFLSVNLLYTDKIMSKSFALINVPIVSRWLYFFPFAINMFFLFLRKNFCIIIC